MKRLQKSPRELKSLLNCDHTLNGGMIVGIDGFVIEVQARALAVLKHPASWSGVTSITGMAAGAVRESTARISGAFAKLRIPEPQVEIQINLVPADMAKVGAALDLPIAIAMLQASGYLPDLPDSREGDFILFGEVGLHGEIRRVPGALSLAFLARPGQALIVPTANEKECSLIFAKPGHEGCRVCGVSLLEEVVEFFLGNRNLDTSLRQEIQFESIIPKATDFSVIRGQSDAKDGAIIAAAGGHNLLMIGPPGEGKSLLASAIPGILPRLTSSEKVELTKIYSACGALENDGVAVTRRPMRAVHHTTSKQALVGGGSKIPKPGEITLSHLGVLFLDEIAEFSRATIETLRQPLETGEISVSRVGGTFTYPCRFTLVAAMNPCPCGYFGSDLCTCSGLDVARYHKKLSGPMLDRIDLQVELQRLSTDERFADSSELESPRLRAKVEAARNRQIERFKGTEIPFNAAMPAAQVREYCKFSEAGFTKYKACINQHTMSTRTMDRLAKVTRTIADLAGSDTVEPKHLEKAQKFVLGGLLRASF